MLKNLLLLGIAVCLMISCTSRPSDKLLFKKVQGEFGKIYFEKYNLDFIKYTNSYNEKVSFGDIKFTVFKTKADFQFSLKNDMICIQQDSGHIPYCELVSDVREAQKKELENIKTLIGKNNIDRCPLYSLSCKGVPYTEQEVEQLIVNKKVEHGEFLKKNLLKAGYKFPIKSVKLSLSCEKQCGDDSSWGDY